MHKYLKTFIILNYIDVILTYLILSNLNDPTIQETNSLYVFIFKYIGIFFGLFLLKTIGMVLFCFLYNSIEKEINTTADKKYEEMSKKTYITITRENLDKFIKRVYIFLNIIYILIIINNLYWLYQNFKYI